MKNPAESLISALQRTSPERRRVWAAWVLIASFFGWIGSHVVLVALGESSFFNHVLMGISWWAIVTTAADLIFTSDVRAES